MIHERRFFLAGLPAASRLHLIQHLSHRGNLLGRQLSGIQCLQHQLVGRSVERLVEQQRLVRQHAVGITLGPEDQQARLDLATALMAANDAEGAIDELLELFRRDREWNDGAAKSQLFKIFDALGPKDPVALTGRRRLSSMIFA